VDLKLIKEKKLEHWLRLFAYSSSNSWIKSVASVNWAFKLAIEKITISVIYKCQKVYNCRIFLQKSFSKIRQDGRIKA
jgi:hypothetical protein